MAHTDPAWSRSPHWTVQSSPGVCAQGLAGHRPRAGFMCSLGTPSDAFIFYIVPNFAAAVISPVPVPNASETGGFCLAFAVKIAPAGPPLR